MEAASLEGYTSAPVHQVVDAIQARAATPTEASFDTPTIPTVAGGHRVHDMYPGFRGVLLPLLIPNLGISLASAGLLAAILRLARGAQRSIGRFPRQWQYVSRSRNAGRSIGRFRGRR